MYVFYDTEFTCFLNPSLISLGCVAENGAEFYAELSDTYQVEDCSDFVREAVLPALEQQNVRLMETQVAHRLSAWIDSLTDMQVILVSDSPPFDWPLVEALFQSFDCWPIKLVRTAIFPKIDQRDEAQYEDALSEYWLIPEHRARQHHALIDARRLLYAHERVHHRRQA